MSSGRDSTTVPEFGYNLLETGTITGFTFSLDKKPIAKGSDYSLSASQLTNALVTSVEDGTALPLFDFWISIPTEVSGTAHVVEGNFENLLPEYVNIKSINFTNPSPVITLTAAQETADKNLLAEISSAYVLDVHNTNGSWTTTGHGDGLTIHDKPAVDTITGGGSGEDFVFNAGFERPRSPTFTTI